MGQSDSLQLRVVADKDGSAGQHSGVPTLVDPGPDEKYPSITMRFEWAKPGRLPNILTARGRHIG